MILESLKTLFQKTRLAVVFGLFPLVVYWFWIRPDFQKIDEFQQGISSNPSPQTAWRSEIAPASEEELKALRAAGQAFLGKIKNVRSHEELLRFCATLIDALAGQARLTGLKVLSVEIDGDLVKGQYVPDDLQALSKLAKWPAASLSRTEKPVSLAALELPFLEVAMNLTGDFSKAFSFTEQIAHFPSLVSVSEMRAETAAPSTTYHLKVRGYYWTGPLSSGTAQLSTKNINAQDKANRS